MRIVRRLKLLGLSTSCAVAVAACGLSAAQRQNITRWEAETVRLGHPELRFREELNPGKAARLGFLPFGIAGFYVHRPGMAVSGILCWPLSITWIPAMAYKSAHDWNYQEFRRSVDTLRMETAMSTVPVPAGNTSDKLDHIERLWREGKISDGEYQESRRKILGELSR
jgi:hypothetical protein